MLFRSNVDGAIYQSVFDDIVLSVGGSAGLIESVNNAALRITNRFYVGGDNLRGFRNGGIGPRDANTGDALGGKYFYTGTAEVSYPIPGLPKELPVFGKGFIDVGSLWGKADDSSLFNILDSQKMRVASGVGVQWVSPFGPIRLDYAWVIQKEAWDRTENLRVGFGTRF